MEITNDPAAGAEARARTLEAAALVLQEEFGVLYARDLIRGLRSCASIVRTRHSGTSPIIAPQEQRPRNATLERQVQEGWDDPLPGDEPGHGYHEAGDYP